MVHTVRVVGAGLLQQLLKVVGSISRGCLAGLAVGRGDKAPAALLLVLLVPFAGTVGRAFVGCVVLLGLVALGSVKDCPHRLLAGGMVGGNVEELLGGPRTLAA